VLAHENQPEGDLGNDDRLREGEHLHDDPARPAAATRGKKRGGGRDKRRGDHEECGDVMRRYHRESTLPGGLRVIEEGKPAPDFELQSDSGDTVKLSDFRGHPVVLYFYPKDDTPGCTTEACEFRDAYDVFRNRGAVVLGVSPDDVVAHEKFKTKYSLPFTLLADRDHKVAESYGVWGEKKFAGKKYMGINRSTFVIDKSGNVARAMLGIKPAGHATDVLEALPA
jgi:thioredoxin-dependent peroxiredoxin